MGVETEKELEQEGEMGVRGGGKVPLFETRVGKGRTLYQLYAFSVFLAICLILVYRALHIPANGEKGKWAWIGLSMAEIWFGFYWILTQSLRWKLVYHHTFKDRLKARYKDNLPGVDIFVCTADPKIEPPIMVINTVLSVMAYEYPTEKLSVYLSDDGGSVITFYALLEASKFAKAWIPFCKKYKIEPRSPGAYFKEVSSGPDDGLGEWMDIKRRYEEMENSINSVANSGVINDDIRKQHKGFSDWNGTATPRDHQPILEILIDGRDGARDTEGHVLPTLVYMAREKRPHRHHNFKAGAMNSLLRVSSEISNGEFVLNVDCDMYSNNSETIKDALCFFMDEQKGCEVAFIQLPQHYNNVTKNDLYGSSILSICEIDFHGVDGYGGPLYIGSGCYHRRESLLGKKNGQTHKLELVARERDYKSTSLDLEERAKNLITCTFEDNTQWGTERRYEEMENSINSVANSGVVNDDIRKQHKGFSDWNGTATPRDHQPILEILIDGRDGARDTEGHVLPTLVYMAREKRPHRHHNFKAGAMNSLLRVSSKISNGEFILNVDCDMYSNNSETIKDALCFFMDEQKGCEFAFIQLPQHYNNVTKNDLYGSSILSICEIDFHGLDGYGGPLYVGSGCYHRRESLLGKKNGQTHKLELVARERDYKSTSLDLEERAKNLITCTFEDNTQWGTEVGLKYGSPVEDVITGLSIQCNGWKSVYFNPRRRGFLGVAPVTLEQVLVQHKRWSEGNFQIFLSKYNPISYGHNKIAIGLQMGYATYGLWAPCSIPTLYYAIIPPLYFLHGISLFPYVSDTWFLPFAYVITVTTIYSLLESLEVGYTLKGWWNEQRIWLYKRLASYPFALFDTVLKQTGIAKSAFVITAKVASDEVLKRYEKEVIEFGSASLPIVIIATVAVLSPVCLIMGLWRLLVVQGVGLMGSMLVQVIICGVVTLINLPVYEAMLVRQDAGRIPTLVALISLTLSYFAYVLPLH